MRSTVCNAGVKSSLLSDGLLDAGKAANLFSASRRFRALASLAVAHSGIVFLLLHLSLLPGKRKGWMFTELAASDSSFADRHGDLLPGAFSDWMVRSWENTPVLFHIWGQPQKLPWEGKRESSRLPAGKGCVRVKVLALLAWAVLSLAQPEVDSKQRKHARQLTCNLRKHQIQTCGGS